MAASVSWKISVEFTAGVSDDRFTSVVGVDGSGSKDWVGLGVADTSTGGKVGSTVVGAGVVGTGVAGSGVTDIAVVGAGVVGIAVVGSGGVVATGWVTAGVVTTGEIPVVGVGVSVKTGMGGEGVNVKNTVSLAVGDNVHVAVGMVGVGVSVGGLHA